MNMIKETAQRIIAKTPKYFRKIQIYGVALSGAAFAVKTLDLGLPEWVDMYANYVIVIGVFVAGFAQTVTTKSSE